MSEALHSDDGKNSADKNPADNHGEYVAPRDHPQITSMAHDAGHMVHGACSDGQQLDGGDVESLYPEWFVDSVLKTDKETRLDWCVRENSDASHWKGDEDE